MPIWAYNLSPVLLVLIMVSAIEAISLIGLLLARRLLLPRLHLDDGVNDAVSGTVQAIGVFYGITVGLIAVGVWNTNSNAEDLVSKEAASMGAIYRDVSSYPEPVRTELQNGLREYARFTIDQAWPAQRQGRLLDGGTRILEGFRTTLFAFEPKTPGQQAMHAETLRAYNVMTEYRRLRIDAVGRGLSGLMWAVIWVGAAISIGVAFFYKLADVRVHLMLVALMAGFLAIVLFMIVVNDRPFFGAVGISADSYRLILEKVMELPPG
jgi:hypothetical protein